MYIDIDVWVYIDYVEFQFNYTSVSWRFTGSQRSHALSICLYVPIHAIIHFSN